MIQEIIFDLLMQRRRVLLRGVGVISLQRQWAKLSGDNQIIPPHDNLAIEHEGGDFDVDIADACALSEGVSYEDGYRIWCDFLAMEAVDGVLTIEGVAMIDIDQLDVVALDPNFAEQITPDNEIIELEHLEYQAPPQRSSKKGYSEINNTATQNISPQRMRKPVASNNQGIGFLSYLAIIMGGSSIVYLAYFFLS